MDAMCCHPDCPKRISKGRVACPEHWQTVDATVRRQVQWRLYGWHDAAAAREYLMHFFKKQKG